METALSSNHFSTDLQALDVLNWMEVEHPIAFEAIRSQFPEVGNIIFEISWFDTEAMGVDQEWGSWLVDALEGTGLVWWEEGEPWGFV